jgi:MFS family permease
MPGIGKKNSPIQGRKRINTILRSIQIPMASERAQRNVLLASALGSSLAPFMVSALIVALPVIGQEFSADVPALSLLTNIFFIAAAVFLVPFGKIADTFGVKKIFTLGITVYFISAVLCIIAPDIRFLTAARCITGTGAGMVFGTSIALLSLVFPESERGKAIGINVGAMSGGFLLGFLLGGVLIFYSGWRTIFFLTIPVEILVIWLIFSRIRGECELVRTPHLDVPGMMIYGLTLFLIMSGFTMLPQQTGTVILLSGVLCLILFLVRENRVNNPLIDIPVIGKNRLFLTTNLIVILFNASNFAVIFLTSLYLQDIRNLDPRAAGLILLTTVIFMVLLSPFAGKLSDRFEPVIVIGTGAALSSAGLIIYTFLDSETSLFLIILALSLVGAGIAFCQSPLVRTTVSAVPKGMYGLASGMIETMRLLGMTISVAIAGIVFGVFLGNTPLTTALFPVFMHSFRLCFIILFGFSIACLFVIRTLKRRNGTGVPLT